MDPDGTRILAFLPYRLACISTPAVTLHFVVLKARWQLKAEQPQAPELAGPHPPHYNSGRGRMTLTLQPRS
jgi:hypothetical protein